MSHSSLDKLRQSMVRILNADGKTAGSGFIIRADGYLVTCHHVIYHLESLTVEYQGREYSAQWCEELSNPEVDIAILKIPVKDAVAVSIINPSKLATAVTVYGFPPRQERFFPEGFPVAGEDIRPSAPLNVLATYPTHNITANNPWNKLPPADANFLSHRINAKVDKGTSGGPVFADELEGVVGVIQCSKSDESYVIRWDNILSQLDQLGLEPEKNAVCDFLTEIEENFKYIKLFHTQQPIVLTDQYIPIQVTLERRYIKSTETTWSYGESEAELRQAYALKGINEESQRTQVDWKEAKKEHEKIVVLADPGMGKSTLLRMEALTTAQQERQKLEDQQIIDQVIFPIFLRLSELAKKLAKTDTEVVDIIPDLIKLNHVKTFDKIKYLLEQKLKQGKCLLLLDALDEVPTEQRISLIEKLSRFTRNYPCKIISTSRIVGYGGSPVESAKEVEIVPFRQQQTENYIQTWFNNAKEHLEDDLVSAEGLIQELKNKPQINGLAQNPLLLSLLCSLYQTKGLILPARKVQVYEQAVSYMLSTWRSDNHRLASESGWVIAKKKLLATLAYQFSSEGKEVFSEEELWEKINQFLQQENIIDFRNTTPTALIRELTEEDGIIQKLDREGNLYLFLHRTFQEYFTASYLKNQDVSHAKALFWNYNQHETLTLLAGMMKDPIPLITAIYNEKDDIFKTQLLLAGRCIAECGEISHPIITEIINKIYQFWREYRDLNLIKSTLVSLGQTSSLFVESLIAALENEESDVRRCAALALGNIGSEVAVEPLIAALENEDSSVRGYAANALGNIGSEAAVEPLIAALEDEYERVISYAAEALGCIGSQQAVEALIFALGHKSYNLEKYAAKALGCIGSQQAAEALIAVLENENSFVKKEATEALGRIGSQQAVEALIVALGHRYRDVVSCAAKALGNIGSEAATEPLIATLGHEYREVRGDAAKALGNIGSEAAVEPLITALEGEERYVRSSAAEALGNIGSEAAVEPLITALEDEDIYVRNSAAEALGNIGSEAAVEGLITALGHESSDVRRSAAIPLGRMGSEAAVEGLITALKDEDSDVRMCAAIPLGKMGSEVAVEPLIAALGHKDQYVRGFAASALGNISSKAAVEPLIAALEHKDKHVRRLAATPLGKMGSEAAVEGLIAALEDEDTFVRSLAPSALGNIGTAEVLKQLIQNPTVDIYKSDLFTLARKLAIQFSQKNLPFIPVYPELVEELPTEEESSTETDVEELSAETDIKHSSRYIQRSRYKKILAATLVILATFVTLHFSGTYSLPFLRQSQPEQSSP